jgi:hypothetical protein
MNEILREIRNREVERKLQLDTARNDYPTLGTLHKQDYYINGIKERNMDINRITEILTEIKKVDIRPLTDDEQLRIKNFINYTSNLLKELNEIQIAHANQFHRAVETGDYSAPRIKKDDYSAQLIEKGGTIRKRRSTKRKRSKRRKTRNHRKRQ